MVENARDFMVTCYMTRKQVGLAKDQVEHLFDKVSLFELLSTYNLLCKILIRYFGHVVMFTSPFWAKEKHILGEVISKFLENHERYKIRSI